MAFSLAVGSAMAQTEIRSRTPAQSLACLVKPDKPPRYPERHKLDRGFGGMRVLLKFTRPDAKPEVEVLFNSAREDMQDEVYRYLARYRLPCLTPADGEVSAVQEFSFANTDREPTPLEVERNSNGLPFCVVMPRESMDVTAGMGLGKPQVQHVVVAATFAGGGDQGPEVKILHSSGSTRMEAYVRDYLAQYRMPCRKGGEEPQSFQQHFSFFPNELPRYGFKREAFRLAEFLGMTQDPKSLRANYDFNTMACPFKVKYTLYGGAVPNEATVSGPPNPNRLPFLSWLAELKFSFKTEHQANSLFGSTLQIDVPCGTLTLDGDAPREAR